MTQYLLLFRSLTQAQRALQLCKSMHFPATLVRSPKSVAGDGCSHSLRVSDSSLQSILNLLRQNNIAPRKIFRVDRGAYREVSL